MEKEQERLLATAKKIVGITTGVLTGDLYKLLRPKNL
jgi:hypothetical protein